MYVVRDFPYRTDTSYFIPHTTYSVLRTAYIPHGDGAPLSGWLVEKGSFRVCLSEASLESIVRWIVLSSRLRHPCLATGPREPEGLYPPL